MPPLGSGAKSNAYPPEAHGVDESTQRVIICLQDTFHSQALGPEPLHGTRCNLVFGLAGEHQRQEYLIPPHLFVQGQGLGW